MGERPLQTEGQGLVNKEVKPILEAVAMFHNEVDVSFDRGNMHGVLIETRSNGGPWKYAGRYFISPATIGIKNGTDVRYVEIRARYIKDMEPVGQDSDPVSVVITP